MIHSDRAARDPIIVVGCSQDHGYVFPKHNQQIISGDCTTSAYNVGNTTELTIAEYGEGLDELHSTFEHVYRLVAKADDWLRELLAAYYESQFRSSASDHPPSKESEGAWWLGLSNWVRVA